MKFLALIAALVFVADAAIVRRDSCEAYIQTCVAPLEAYNAIFQDFGAGASQMDDSQLDQFCSAMRTMTQCVGNGGHACPADELQANVGGMSAAVTYLCSPGGRQTLRSMASNNCAHNETLMEMVNLNVQMCYNSFEQEINLFVIRAMRERIRDPLAHICPMLTSFRVCTVDATRRICGDAFATFVRAVWDIMMAEQMRESGLTCSGRAKRAHTVVTRALAFATKRK